MDELDHEIQEAARLARQRVWRGRFATIASTATFLVLVTVGTSVVFTLFPQPRRSEYDVVHGANRIRGDEPTAAMLAGEGAAYEHDRIDMRVKVVPVFMLAFAAAYLVRKRLTPQD